MNTIKKILDKHDKLYDIARCFRSINDPKLHKLIKGFYEKDSKSYPLIINEPQFLGLGKRPICIVDLGCNNVCTMGFGAMLRFTLGSLSFSEALGFEPFVIWGENTHYYDSGLDNYSKNVFTYYFKPISDEQVMKSNTPYILSSEIDYGIIHRADSYVVNKADIDYFSRLYKKYIRINNRTEEYLTKQIGKCLKFGKILGVHIRGTDFGVGYRGHPKKISLEEYKNAVKKIMQTGKYNKIFLATDDLNALDVFIREFKDSLFCYDDVFRSSGKTGVHSTQDNRPFHRYKLGLETLRDIYMLAHCDGLICGMSQVSFSARYISQALERKFNDFILLDRGINHSGKVAPAFKRIQRQTK